MAVVSFFCDDTGKYHATRCIGLSGVGLSPERLEKFDKEWHSLLRTFGIQELHMAHLFDLTQSHGRYMPRDQTLHERMQAIYPFADCINEHMEIGLMQAWDVIGYNALKMEVKMTLGGEQKNPHYLAFIKGMLEIVDYLRQGDVVSIVCDDDIQTAWDVYLHYRALHKAMPEVAQKVAGLTFGNSEHFYALQAADMVAFLTRKKAEESFYGEANQFEQLYNYLTGRETGMYWAYMFLGEQQLVDLGNELLKHGQEGKGIPKVRPDNTALTPGSAQRDQSPTGRGEGGKAEQQKAEG